MRIWPLIIDSYPACLGGAARRSLLTVPLGTTTLIEHVRGRVSAVTPNQPTILAPPGAPSEYTDHIQEVCPGARVVLSGEGLDSVLEDYEVSDLLLVVDPRCLPVQATEIASFVRHSSAGQPVAHHLVAFESSVAHTKEQVNVDAEGRVRSVRRFYEPVTWPFVAGVAASLVPMSSAAFRDGRSPTSLAELRRTLMARGVSSRDVAIQGGALDLDQEQGLLGASEHFLVSSSRLLNPTMVGTGQRVHPTARIIGPVAIHADAVIDENVLVVGPALIGPGARVEAGAIVAHALIGTGCIVPKGAIVRDRARFGETSIEAPEVSGAQALSFNDRLARMTTNVNHRDIGVEEDAAPRLQLRAKRVVDIVLATVGLVLLSPLIAIVAAVIALESGRPVFYCARREGLGGREFKCWKFRTMRSDADAKQHQLKNAEVDGPHFKMVRDPRVTLLGRLLRATNTDEVPQLLNVLLGTMSLVGPRPSPFRENQICIPWREARLSVRPGMTGLWQVCRRHRELGDFHQWIEYDLLYVKHVSLLLDLKILLATFFTLGGQLPVPSSWMIRTRPNTVDIRIDRRGESPAARAAVEKRTTGVTGRPDTEHDPSARSA
jgi:lipopolysaccharide/colanic/teichoic acid biosynthesis glycosyltransferase